MAIAPECDKCHEELTEPGGLLFSPPRTFDFGSVQLAAKRHLCVGCYDEVEMLVIGKSPHTFERDED